MKTIHKKLIIAGAIIIALVVFVIVFFPINSLLLNNLSGYEKHDAHDDIVIVLGAGIKKDGGLTEMAEERVNHALAIYQKTNIPLLFSGGETPYGIEAEEMYLFAHESGYSGPKYIEIQSDSTYQNAVFSFEKLSDEKILSDEILLVTSPHHAKRALATFKTVMPAADIDVSSPEQTVILDTTSWGKIKGFKSLLREYLAIIFYRVRYGIST